MTLTLEQARLALWAARELLERERDNGRLENESALLDLIATLEESV